MNYILGLTFILIVFFLISKFLKKRRLKKSKKLLFKNWGLPKEKQHFNFFVIGKYFHSNSHKAKAYHLISDKSKIDFDIDEIFQFIDRTSSKIGQQYLYFKLRTIGTIEDLIKFDSLTSIFKQDKNLSILCQLELSRLNNTNSYYLEELINGKQIDKPKYLGLIKILSCIAIALVFLTFFFPVLGFLFVPILAINMVFHYKNKHNVAYYLNGVIQLSRALKVSEKLSEKLSEVPEIKLHFSNFSFLRKIKSIQFKTEFIAFEKNIQNEFLFAFWFIAEIVKIMFNIEFIVFYSFIDSISKEKNSIEKMYLFIGEIDAAISTASLTSGGLKMCKPTFNDKNLLITKEIHHPLINNCITNNLELSNESVLLTGSNMSGKTTFIRTVAINSILAQTLNICFAEEYSAPFYKIYSSIRITDDLLDNTSYYLQEVLTIKELIDTATDNNPCLFVLDEIFKGTNTIERISGGKAILSFLNKKEHTVFVSTHDIELTDLLEKENYQLYHFSEQIANNKLVFDHKMKKGKLTTRNAIKILELYNYPSEIIKNAKDLESNFFH